MRTEVAWNSRFTGRTRLALASLMGLLLLVGVTSASNRKTKVKPSPDSPTQNELVQLRQLVNEQMKTLEELKLKFTEQSAVIAEQQARLEALQKKQDAAATTGAPVQLASLTSALAAEALAASQTSSQEPATLVAKSGKADEKPPSNALSVGGFRFSGDFRTRFDAIERSATSVAGAVHNARGRYRLRINTDKTIRPDLDFHFQLTTGPLNNHLTMDQDFAAIALRNPFNISEAYVDFHPSKSVSLRVGRMEEVFANNSRFSFDDDLRLAGVSEKFTLPSASKKLGVEFRAGQYVLTNPNTAVVSAGSPLATTGAALGAQARDSQLFHQGAVLKTTLTEDMMQSTFFDFQTYRNANQIALASTAAGYPVLVNPGVGIALSGGVPGTGTATRNSAGTVFFAPRFQIARVAHEVQFSKVHLGSRVMPLTLGVQGSRNVGVSTRRDAGMASLNLGKVDKRGDFRVLYSYAIKDANSMIAQLTDDDMGTNSGVNIRTHHLRADFGLTKGIAIQNLFFIQSAFRGSNPAESFFVPTPRGAGTLYRYQAQLEFKF